MVDRLVSVGDDFTLPPSVKATDANLPERLTPTALSATTAEAIEGRETRRFLALEPWHAALANRDNAPAKWYALGDSITEGAGSDNNTKRWVQRALEGLRRRYNTSGLFDGGGFGHLPPYYNTPDPYPQPWTGQAGPIPVTDPSFGIGRRSAIMTGTSTYTYTINASSFDLWYVQGPSTGTIGVSIDGGAVTSIPTAGSPVTDGKTWNSGPLTAGTHTVTVSVVSGENFFAGITAHNGDESKGIKLYEAGHYGWKTTDWTVNSEFWFATLAAVQPQLLTIALMTNDYQAGIAPSTCKANIETLITSMRARITVDPSIVLVVYPARGDVAAPAYPWQEYVDAAQAIAAADPRVSVLDFTARMTSPAVSTALGAWAGDKVHPSNLGHAQIADAVVGFLSPR